MMLAKLSKAAVAGLVVLCLGGFQALPAQEPLVDKDKLRAAIPLPAVGFWFRFETTDFDPRAPDGRRKDFARRAAELEKRLDGSVRDVEVYLELAECHGFLGQSAQREETARKAVERVRPLLPKITDGRLLAIACEVLTIAQTGKEEREKWARQATVLAPREWRGWNQLGLVRLAQFFSTVAGRADYRLPPGHAQNILPDLIRQNPAPANLDAAEKCLREVWECLDKVRELAPREASALRACIQAEVGLTFQEDMLAALRGKPVQRRRTRDSAVYRDVITLAETCPDNVGCQAQAAFWELMIAERNAPSRRPNGLPQITPADRQRLDRYLDRMAKATANADADAAGICGSQLASFYMTLGEVASAEKQARRALERDPTLANMWEVRVLFLDHLGRTADAVEMARTWLKQAPCPRGSLMLARRLALAGRPQEAEQVLRDSLRRAPPGDAYCNLGLAALLLQRSGKDDTLAEAGRCLEMVQLSLRRGASFELTREFMGLCIIHDGLSDRPDRARELLGRLQANGPEPGWLRQVREALGPPGNPR